MREAREDSGHLTRAIIIWVIASIIGLLVVFFLGPKLPLPPTASQKAGDVNLTLSVFSLLAVPVFMFVVVFMVYSIFAFRSNGRPDRDGPPVHGLPRIQITWLIVSTLLAAVLLAWGLVFLNRADAAPGSGVLNVDVTGEQWMWNFDYPQYGSGGNYPTTNVLELPVNRPVMFYVGSIDVQHSFWIPAMGIKSDAVPGEINHISVTPTVIGTYPIRCMELCGAYHSYMETVVKVVSPSTFQADISSLPMQAPQLLPPAGSGFNSNGPGVAVIRDAVMKRPTVA